MQRYSDVGPMYDYCYIASHMSISHWGSDATCSVARGNEWLTAGLETFLKECRFFTAPWDEDEELEDSEVEVDPEEVEQEVQGLHEEQENPGSGVPE